MTLPALDCLHERSPGELAALPAGVLYELHANVLARLSTSKALIDALDRALEWKYGERAQRQRLAAGKDTGTIRFADEAFVVVADLPKKIEWDQPLLHGLVERIRSGGGDPAEYVEITYRVSEAKYNAWPDSLRSAFTPARTLHTGKPRIRLVLTLGDDA